MDLILFCEEEGILKKIFMEKIWTRCMPIKLGVYIFAFGGWSLGFGLGIPEIKVVPLTVSY